MKIFLLLLICFCSFYQSKAQTTIDSSSFDCDPLIFKCSVSGDYNSFCEAARSAFFSSKLSLKTLGDPGHISACVYHSYKYWGVQLIPIGDIVSSEMEAEVEGHNCVMVERIKKVLGEKYDSLGLLPSHIQDLKTKILDSLALNIQAIRINDDSVKVKLNTSKYAFLASNSFIYERVSKIKYSFNELTEGILLPLKKSESQRQLIVLFIEIGPFPDEANWCGARKWTLPKRIEE